MKIVITGTPGTGKSAAADALAKTLKTKVIHVNDLLRKKRLVIGKERGSYIVDLKKLKKMLVRKKGVIENHLLCEFPLANSVVFVLRCDPKVLVMRMSKRGYPRDKIRENLEVEALDYCTINAEKNYKKVYDVDTTRRTVKQTVDKIIRILKKKEKGDRVDYSSYFLR
jgi:adenylate kinase